MIEKINNTNKQIMENSSSNVLNETGRGPAGLAANILKNQADATVEISYGSLIEKAWQTPPTDAESFDQARVLLLSGRLDTVENIRAAAENMITFGI